MRYSNLNQYYQVKLIDEHTVRKTGRLSINHLEMFSRLMEHFINKPDPMVVPTYSFGIDEMPEPNSRFGIFKYHYDMKRLGMLSPNEKVYIDVASDKRWVFSTTPERKSIYEKTAISRPDLATFVSTVIEQDRYRDLHGGNIMKDEDESYKLIDLESFLNSPLDRPENEWMR
jgi:hypothetical protein